MINSCLGQFEICEQNSYFILRRINKMTEETRKRAMAIARELNNKRINKENEIKEIEQEILKIRTNLLQMQLEIEQKIDRLLIIKGELKGELKEISKKEDRIINILVK